jgi:hypothetical protein
MERLIEDEESLADAVKSGSLRVVYFGFFFFGLAFGGWGLGFCGVGEVGIEGQGEVEGGSCDLVGWRWGCW